MRRILRKLRQVKAHDLRPLFRAYSGHVDGFSGRNIAGWATRRITQSGGLRVGIFVGKRCLVAASADMYRGDVQASGYGDGDCGFEIALSPADLALISAMPSGDCKNPVLASANLGAGRCPASRHA